MHRYRDGFRMGQRVDLSEANNFSLKLCQSLPGSEPTHHKRKGGADAYNVAQLMELHRHLHLGASLHIPPSD
jgi:hypothetical protein